MNDTTNARTIDPRPQTCLQDSCQAHETVIAYVDNVARPSLAKPQVSQDICESIRMRGAVVARVIPVPFETHHLEAIRDIHKVIRSNRVAFISLASHGSLFFCCFCPFSWEEAYLS